jgi:drug/metabolite transporter (DMT)-like permease
VSQALAAAVAVVAAVAFGLSGALQHRADRRARTDPGGGLVVTAVVRNPLWLLSLGLVALAVAAQALALALAPLVLVQPILVTGVIFAAVSAALLDRRPPDRLVITGAAGCSAGLAAFLVLSRPGEGHATGLPPITRLWPLALGLGALLVLCLLIVARRPSEQARTICLALITGILYGANAGLAKLALGQLAEGGLPALLTTWPLYALVVIGPTGFVANQQAFAAGAAPSPAVAVITVTDPLVSLGIAVSWLGEPVRWEGPFLMGEILALLVIVLSVAVLARRAPQTVPRGSSADVGAASKAARSQT